MASLRSSSDNAHLCGGSIISAWHILTAAHCTIDLASPALLRVHVGSTDVTSSVQVRNVAKIYNHPSYSTTTYLNDLAILKLSSALDLDQAGTDLICLPHVTASVLATGEYPAAGIDVNLSSSRLTCKHVTARSFCSSSLSAGDS
jgi:trypsin